MHKIFKEDGDFPAHDIAQFVVPPLPKVDDNRGFLYLLVDRAFPGYFKIGRTIDVKKRLMQYNADKPFDTAEMHYVSRMFENVNHAEKQILEVLKRTINPSTTTREWFQGVNLEPVLELLARAEIEFD